MRICFNLPVAVEKITIKAEGSGQVSVRSCLINNDGISEFVYIQGMEEYLNQII